jgi:hypothetical protein
MGMHSTLPHRLEVASPSRATRFFLFRHGPARQYCLTTDRAGRNLPHFIAAGDWVFIRVVDVVRGEVQPAFDTEAAVVEILEDGYALIASPYHAE